MRYWFDTEFHDHGRTIDLISLALVAEDGREWYAINSEYDPATAHEWLAEHVMPQLDALEDSLRTAPRLTRAQIRDAFIQFVGNDPQPAFWGYFGEYDWIVMRQLFGTLTDWPAGWPLMHWDIEQLRVHLGADRFPEQTAQLHHALADARWTRDCHLALDAARV